MWLVGCNGGGGDGGGTATGTGTGTGTATGTGSASTGTTGSACELDPWESNDGPAEATDLDGVDATALEDRTDALVLDATLCEGADEEDFYTWTLSDAAYVGVEVTFRKEAQDVALELQDDAGQVLVRSEGGRDVQLAHARLGAGTYRVRVQRVAGSPPYRLRAYALSERADGWPGGVSRSVCPRYDLDGAFQDAARGTYGTEGNADRWQPPRLLVRVRSEDGATVLRGWAPLDAGGCTGPFLAPAGADTFEVDHVPWSHFVGAAGGRAFEVVTLDCQRDAPCELPLRTTTWTWSAGPNEPQDTAFVASGVDGSPFEDVARVHWVTSFSESRATLGESGSIYARLLGPANLGTPDAPDYIPCDGAGAYCPNGRVCEMGQPPPNGPVFFHCRPKTRSNDAAGGHPTVDVAASDTASKDAPSQKYIVAHELGHAQTTFLLGADPTAVNYLWCDVDEGPRQHSLTSTEWHSAALVEGFADFYAAAVFHDQGDAPVWTGGASNWADLAAMPPPMNFQTNCVGNLMNLKNKGLCDDPAEDAQSCTAPGAGNEIDWAVALWRFTGQQGTAALPDVLHLLADAMASPGWRTAEVSTSTYDTMITAVAARFSQQVSEDFDDIARNTAGIAP